MAIISKCASTKAPQQKFCAYCKAKGLPESVFTTHFVKDAPGPKGKVICPELLKNECGYCHDLGHTPKHCPKLKARDERRKKAAAKRTILHKPKAQSFALKSSDFPSLPPKISSKEMEKLEIQAEGEAFFEAVENVASIVEDMHAQEMASAAPHIHVHRTGSDIIVAHQLAEIQRLNALLTNRNNLLAKANEQINQLMKKQADTPAASVTVERWGDAEDQDELPPLPILIPGVQD